MSSEHRQSDYEKYGCATCRNTSIAEPTKPHEHNPECPLFRPAKPTEGGRAEKFEALRRAIVALQDNPTAGNCGAAIQIANELETNVTRQLGPIPFTIAPDLTQDMVKALLAEGFDLALSAVVPQLKTVRLAGSMIAWDPPENPFRYPERASECTCLNAGALLSDCPVHGSEGNVRACGCPAAYPCDCRKDPAVAAALVPREVQRQARGVVPPCTCGTLTPCPVWGHS
jgi:hypothetical protein